jgi:hypothetical protein
MHRVIAVSSMKNSYNYKEKEVLVDFHCRSYHQVKRRLQIQDLVGDMREALPVYALAYVLTIDDVLHSLDEDSYRIINHDFLHPTRKNWWMEYYAKTTYYRLKARSMDAFLRCLHG